MCNTFKMSQVHPRPPHCWILTDGKIGTEKQCIALAEALGLSYRLIRFTVGIPWRWLPPSLWLRALFAVTSEEGFWERGRVEGFQTLPDVILSATRVAAAPAAALRELVKTRPKRPLFIHLLNPFLPPAAYDALVVPAHDRIQGPTVFPMAGALTSVSPTLLNERAAEDKFDLSQLPHPRIAVLIGGNSRHYKIRDAHVNDLLERMSQWHTHRGASFMVTTSRRTPATLTARLRLGLREKQIPHVFWSGTAPNPYEYYLAAADRIWVTVDSVSMIADAAASGKPVSLIPLSGHARKFQSYHQQLRAVGILQPLEEMHPSETATPVLEANRVAGLLKARFPEVFTPVE